MSSLYAMSLYAYSVCFVWILSVPMSCGGSMLFLFYMLHAVLQCITCWRNEGVKFTQPSSPPLSKQCFTMLSPSVPGAL